MFRRISLVLAVAVLAAAVRPAPGQSAGQSPFGVESGFTVAPSPATGLRRAPTFPLYRVSLALEPARPKAGVSGTAVVTVVPVDGIPFPPADEARATFTLVGRTMEEFATVEQAASEPVSEGSLKGAKYTFPLTFPSGERYCLIAEFSDRGSRIAHLIDIPVEGPRQPRTRWNYGRVREVGGVRAVLRSDPLRSLKDLLLDVEFTAGGAPVTDLEPINGVWAEVMVFREGLGSWALLPGDTRRSLDDIIAGKPAPAGPKVWFRHRFPTDDKYRLWVRVRRGGKTLTFPFDLPVEAWRDFERRED